MGSAKLRRILYQEQKWTDKTAYRHKHNFNIKAIAQLREGDTGYYSYHNVMKCDKCNSFRSIPSPGAITGFISDVSNVDFTLPIIKLYTPHKYLIGWKDVVLDLN